MDDEPNTLDGKYLVERYDGQHRPDARYFVLDYASDPYARAAMLAYADACATTRPRLAEKVRAVVAYHEQRDAQRRRDASKPIRGTQASGGDAVSGDDLVDVLRRKIADDPELATALRSMLAKARQEPPAKKPKPDGKRPQKPRKPTRRRPA